MPPRSPRAWRGRPARRRGAGRRGSRPRSGRCADPVDESAERDQVTPRGPRRAAPPRRRRQRPRAREAAPGGLPLERSPAYAIHAEDEVERRAEERHEEADGDPAERRSSDRASRPGRGRRTPRTVPRRRGRRSPEHGAHASLHGMRTRTLKLPPSQSERSALRSGADEARRGPVGGWRHPRRVGCRRLHGPWLARQGLPLIQRGGWPERCVRELQTQSTKGTGPMRNSGSLSALLVSGVLTFAPVTGFAAQASPASPGDVGGGDDPGGPHDRPESAPAPSATPASDSEQYASREAGDQSVAEFQGGTR